MSTTGPYATGLKKTPANYSPLTPVSFIQRAAQVYPDQQSVVFGEREYTWAETYARSRRLASALLARGVGRGDTVAVLASNIPEMYEASFAVPMMGGVVNTLNTRLDAATIAFMLNHGEAKVLLVDQEFSAVAAQALQQVEQKIIVVGIADESLNSGEVLGEIEYEALLTEGDPKYDWQRPPDEWDAISLNYTSGTTGNPKGVVYHHRGAYLNALSNAIGWNMGHHPVYLWTLPMFHCNGWCFPWTLAAVAGTSICLRKVAADTIWNALDNNGVTHFCGAPIVLSIVANAEESVRRKLPRTVEVMTAAAPPPASVLEAMEAAGFHTTHVYGLTETYGPAVVCAWKPQWDDESPKERSRLRSRQGVPYHVLDGLSVMNPDTMEPVPADGETIGEIMFQGNIVMKGYLKNPSATDEAFAGGWFHSGDLGVMHSDGYIQIRDRSKDIIISGGENISSIEVEDVLYRHRAVLEAAVVAVPDDRWGEVPWAFVAVREGQNEISEADLIQHCRDNMARFKVPKKVVFQALPKTSTGKVQKFVLREQAKTESQA